MPVKYLVFHISSNATVSLLSYDPVRLLTSLGADLYAVDHAHCTALHHAAEHHNHLAVKHLVSVRAPLDLKNKQVGVFSCYCSTYITASLGKDSL